MIGSYVRIKKKQKCVIRKCPKLIFSSISTTKKSIPNEIQNVFTDLFIVRKHLSYFYVSQSGFIGKIINDSVT